MLVLDASALVVLLSAPDRLPPQWYGRLTEDELHAPHLIDAEVGNVLRRYVRLDEISAELAELLLGFSWLLVDIRHEHGPLAAAAWSMRHNLTFYDALYVALAAALDAPLVTTDARLASAPGLPCAVELLEG